MNDPAVLQVNLKYKLYKNKIKVIHGDSGGAIHPESALNQK